MTADAIAHCECVLLRQTLHRLDRTVTGLAADTAGNVPAVVECDKVGKVIDLHPFDRSILGDRSRDLLYLGRIGKYLRMTVHTGRGRRHAGNLRPIGGRMTKKARDLVVACVKFVGEIDRLNRLVTQLITVDPERLTLPNKERPNKCDQYH